MLECRLIISESHTQTMNWGRERASFLKDQKPNLPKELFPREHSTLL